MTTAARLRRHQETVEFSILPGRVGENRYQALLSEGWKELSRKPAYVYQKWIGAVYTHDLVTMTRTVLLKGNNRAD